MTEIEFLNKILRIMPNATIGEDSEGQVIIYTDMKFDQDNNLVDIDREDE